MKYYRVLILLGLLVIVTACQSDSDYLIGEYDVTTTVKLSSCPAQIFEFFHAAILPTGVLAGQISHSAWHLQRSGITGSGAEKLAITITSPDVADFTLELTGTLDHNLLYVENQRNLRQDHCEIYRFVVIYGRIAQGSVNGELRTILSHPELLPTCPDTIPSFFSCEVYAEFSGKNREPRNYLDLISTGFPLNLISSR